MANQGGMQDLLAGRISLDYSKLGSDVQTINNILAGIGQNATSNISALTTQINNLGNAMRNAQSGSSNGGGNRNQMSDSLMQMRDAYRQLAQATREYNNATRNGNTSGANYFRQSAINARNTIEQLRTSGAMTTMNAEEQRRWNDYINMAGTQFGKLNKQISSSERTVSNLVGIWDSVYNRVKMLAAVKLAAEWRKALEYAKDFDKAVTDIAIVTQRPVENVRAMASEYRSLASELQSTSTSLATAASTIYRQGITDDREVSGIIKGVTKFGAVTDLSTDQAIQVMTASMQNFKKETESTEQVVNRIGDTWSYMGDAVATEGSDIAEAMSKASASVASVGLEFERASAYAAIMLARTQQSGQVIGTQLNSLVSRYSKITSTGFRKITEDDEGKALSFNDVSKALKEANIEIYDAMEGTFMDMGTMLDELSDKWDGLSESQQRYIATAVSGTRGMNYFLTLMENYDEAMSLEETAKNSEGIVDEKYTIWLEGVEAAQNDLKNSLEELYAVLEADTITTFYHKMAGLVDGFTDATKAVDGWNIKAAAAAAGVITLISGIAKLSSAIGAIRDARRGGQGFSALSILSKGNIGIIIAGIAAIITAVGALTKAFKEPAVDLGELHEKMIGFQDKAKTYDNLADSVKALGDTTSTAKIETQEFYDLRKDIVSDSPALQAAYGQEGEKITSLAEAYAVVAEEANKAREAAANLAATVISENVTDFNDKVKSIFGTESDKAFTFEEYQSSFPNLERDAFSYLDYLYNIEGKISSDTSLKALQEYMNELTMILTSDEVAMLPQNSPLYQFANKMYANLKLLMSGKNFEIAELKATLYDILFGTTVDHDYGRTFTDNAAFTESIIQGFIPTDLSNVKADVVQADFKEYLDVVYGALVDGLDESNIDSANAIYNKMKQSGYDVSILDGMIDAFYYAANRSHGLKKSIGSGVGAEFFDAVWGGEFTADFLQTFKKKAEGMNDFDFIDLMKKVLGMNEEERFKWKADVDLELGTNEAEVKSEVESFKAMIQSKMDEIGVSMLLTTDNESLVSQYEKFGEMIRELQSIEGSSFSSLFEGVEISNVISAMEQMSTIVEAIESLQSGEFDSDMLKSLVDDGILGSEYLGDTETSITALRIALEYLTAEYGKYIEALGMSTPKTEDFADKVADAISPMSKAQKAINKLNKEEQLSVDELSELADEYPELSKEINAYAKDTKDATKLVDALNKAHQSKAIDDWADGVESALDSLDNAEAGTREYSKTMEELGNLFGAQYGNMDSLEFATQNLENIKAAANGSVDAFRALQEAAFVNVVGTSNVDFSAVTNGLALVGDQAVAVGNLLAATGMGTVEYKELNGNADVLRYENGIPIIDNIPLNGKVAIWKPSSNNPFSKGGYGGGGKSSGGGGGGGGGGGSSNISVSSATEKLLDNMEKTHDAYDNKVKLLELRREYHEIRGEIQGVIEYTKAESDILAEQNKILAENVKKLEAEIASKEATMAKNKASSKAYKQAAADLDELNEAHAEYSELLLENRNRIEEIVKELEEFDEEARQTVISVQDLIRETLEQHEEHLRDMLNGAVDLEDTILEVIRARYEREQELIIETAELKKEALQDEIDAIDELIEARQKLLDEEEKAEQIAELEAKIARISADPTRRKELLSLQEELTNLRKEQAWETYEEEMNAQKESLEDQITNLDDYIEYVNEYYEELFKNPEKLIAEMKEIIGKTDTEIVDWLKKNHEEFSSYTESKQEQMIQDWQELIDQMRGVTETYHDEVDEIMSWTDAEIIEWLKKYNVEFQNATEEQQESFLHSWKNTLEEWRNAYKNVSTDISSTSYSSGSSSGGSGGSGGGGGGGGGSVGGGGSSAPKSYSAKAAFKYKLQKGGWSSNYSTSTTSKVSEAMAVTLAATSALSKAKSAAASYYKDKLTGTALNTALNKINNASVSSPGSLLKRAYKTGGLAFETGPAWLDGTPTAPERVLSSYQTQLFEDMIKTLHEIKQVRVAGISSVKAPEYTNGNNSYNIESIVVHVDSLNDDTDFEELADKVGEVILDKVTRTMSIGGITL